MLPQPYWAHRTTLATEATAKRLMKRRDIAGGVSFALPKPSVATLWCSSLKSQVSGPDVDTVIPQQGKLVQ